MCGIAGYLTTRERSDLGDSLRRMAGAIAHRGPDDEGFFAAAAGNGTTHVGLAHRRLSIIDLSTGHQPMGNEDGTVQIVFNGEIYNFQGLREELLAKGHVFRTRSDTETIVHAYEEWGPECVGRFRGMFAFAIWDAKRERLFLARDRYGKKPLFLYEEDGLLLFGSEIKALLAFPDVAKRVDRAALWHYFAYRYVPGPATLFAGIRKLMPGSWLVHERGQSRESRYFTPADREKLSQPRVPQDPPRRLPGAPRRGGSRSHDLGCAVRSVPLRRRRFLGGGRPDVQTFDSAGKDLLRRLRGDDLQRAGLCAHHRAALPHGSS